MSDELHGTILSDPEDKGGRDWDGVIVTVEEEDGTLWSVAGWNEVGERLAEFEVGDEVSIRGQITDMDRNRFTAYHIERA